MSEYNAQGINASELT